MPDETMADVLPEPKKPKRVTMPITWDDWYYPILPMDAEDRKQMLGKHPTVALPPSVLARYRNAHEEFTAVCQLVTDYYNGDKT